MITLDLPVPPSINRTKRPTGEGLARVRVWILAADRMALAQCAGRSAGKITGPFEIRITFGAATGIDLDNGPKHLIDYLRRIRIIQNDDKSRMMRVILERGTAPEGVRVTVTPLVGG